MRLVTYVAGDGQPRVGLERGGSVLDVNRLLAGRAPGLAPVGDMLELIRRWPELEPVLRAAWDDPAAGWEAAATARLLAPIPRPARNVFCVGRNYPEHVAEGARYFGRTAEVPDVPVFFTKPPSAVVGPEADIIRHGATRELDYEVELAVVIGREGRDIPPERAMDHVFGYTIVNDVSARDLQSRYRQWFKGKSLDTFCPMGPAIVHRSAVPDPYALTMRLRVNGEVRQQERTGEMIFRIDQIIAHLSAGMTLEPGDVIATGTCSGVAFAMDPPRWLQPGDVVEAEIEGIGVLRNRVAEPR